MGVGERGRHELGSRLPFAPLRPRARGGGALHRICQRVKVNMRLGHPFGQLARYCAVAGAVTLLSLGVLPAVAASLSQVAGVAVTFGAPPEH